MERLRDESPLGIEACCVGHCCAAKICARDLSSVTLYEVVREVALDQDWEWIDRPAGKVNYQRDIYPILLRAAETAWVANEARRGHGYDKRGDFRKWKPGRKLKLDAKLPHRSSGATGRVRRGTCDHFCANSQTEG
jgi:hypothetical protein